MAYAEHCEQSIQEQLSQQGLRLPMSRWETPSLLAHQEQACESILELLEPHTLRGWHCTRLTTAEVRYIKANGLQPPNLEILRERIDTIQADGMITASIADRLRAKNQSDDQNRRGMIWFCFFPPELAGQHGIERFFRRWGGEALYNSHESDPETGTALQTIGSPCLIEVDVFIRLFSGQGWLSKKIIRRYLLDRGLKTEEEIDHEDRVRESIAAKYVKRFVFHGDSEFDVLTGCNTWSPPL